MVGFDIEEVKFNIIPSLNEKQVKDILQRYLPQIKDEKVKLDSEFYQDLESSQRKYLMADKDNLWEGWYITTDGSKIMYLGCTKYNNVRYEQLHILTE